MIVSMFQTVLKSVVGDAFMCSSLKFTIIKLRRHDFESEI